MEDLNKMKFIQLPYVVKDIDDNTIGHINVSINNNLTNASISLNFQSESKVVANKEIVKQAYDSIQVFFKQEMINCGWGFLFEDQNK